MDKNQLYVAYGSDAYDTCKQLLPRTGLAEELAAGMKVCLKPNLVVAKPSTSGATTDPGLVSAVIEFLQEHGVKDITIAESAWVGEKTGRAFKVCGYEELSRRYGVPLVDLKKDRVVTVSAGKYDIKVAHTVLAADYLINMPVLKAHCQTRLTCALKNLKGCIPDAEKRRFHGLGLHEPIVRLNTLVRTNLVIVDGLVGDLTFEEGGTPVRMDRIIAARDPVLADAYAAGLIGYDTGDIEYIGLAERLGVGSANLAEAEVVEINRCTAGRVDLAASPKARNLARWIEEREACSACYGTLVHALARLEERGKLDHWRHKVRVGQGFKGVADNGIGIGMCTGECKHHLPGCPPAAHKVVKFLEEMMA